MSALDRLKSALGPDGWSEDPDRLAPKLVEWRERWRGETPLLLLPRTVEEVAAVVRLCAEAGLGLVPQGGNTGLVGGQIPRGEVLLSTERMRRIVSADRAEDVLVAQAGATLAELHAAAEGVGRRFPLSLASEGSATLGGLVSTNAGGVAVLRFGMMRDLVLGLEAVLPNGEIWNGLKRLRKDNTGYDLKQLLIGAEGTLGVVTAAAVKLFPRPRSTATAVAGVASPADAARLLVLAKDMAGPDLEAFEIVARLGVDLAVRHLPGAREPLASRPPWIVLLELASFRDDAADRMERLLESALEAGLADDAVPAQSEAQARSLWAIREGQSAAQKPEGLAWKHDVSVPLARVADFIAEAAALMEDRFPGVRVLAFGHMGDGNIHFDVLPPPGGDAAAHAAGRNTAAGLVHDLVVAMEGSISAEHGLGTMKTAEAAAYKSSAELAALRALRRALDPKRIMNPRTLF